ncbi:MAG: DsbA family protein [Gemmatimonadales bacterium]
MLRPAATRITGSLREGNPKSPFVLVEFTDYFCPFCGTWAVTHLPELSGKFATTAGLEIVVRNYPIREIHPQSMRVASLVECAIDAVPAVGWKLYGSLYARGESLDSAGRDALVRTSGLSAAEAGACFGAKAPHPRVTRDMAEGARLGIRGTPTFILGRRVGVDSVVGMLLDGAYPAKEIKRLLDSLRSAGR